VNVTFDFRCVIWPETPVDAAAHFYSELAPQIREILAGGLLADLPDLDQPPNVAAVIFPEGDHTHRGWRLAAIQALAREVAPKRINGIEATGEDNDAVDGMTDWLAQAEAITGQILAVDGKSGERV
jgi:hypothetical protein